jgi:hypothetical protein
MANGSAPDTRQQRGSTSYRETHYKGRKIVVVQHPQGWVASVDGSPTRAMLHPTAEGAIQNIKNLIDVEPPQRYRG